MQVCQSTGDQYHKKTVSVTAINNIAEENFGTFDKLIGGKTNVNIITFEAIITNRTSETSEWRKNLSPEKISLLMKWARESASKQYRLFKKCRVQIRKTQKRKTL